MRLPHRPHSPAVLSNARVLGEGIDVPAIDAVVFVDPKNSPVDTVQAVGRALRQQPGAGKRATLVVPVYLTPGETPTTSSAPTPTPRCGTPSRPCAPTTTASKHAWPTPALTARRCPPKTPKTPKPG
ncbi:helicase-related protein [Streptomyces sp. NPDC056910]|uniref:helicase-related protein n=1 Tax=Streptomyces sp. NPDC056910 TaxID=3345964 RepID=UPI0036B7F45D